MIENLEAERAILGAAILSPFGADVLCLLNGSDFTDTRHRTIAAVISEMVMRDRPIDPLTVVAELRNRGKLSTPGGAGGLMYVTDLTIKGREIVPENAEHYADEIRKATRVRAAHFAGRDLAEKTQLEDAAGEIDHLLNKHQTTIDSIPGPLVEDDDNEDTLARILLEHDAPDDWLIPGLLTREERMVLVAGEGFGKTSLMRQFAVCLAGGLNPWNGRRVSDGLRVLFVDAENSRNQSRRAYRWVYPRCISPMIAPGWKDRIVHKSRNDGVDLPGADAVWFRDVAARVAPDVILMGSAYKLMAGDPQKDLDVGALFRIIDKVRVQHRCAVLIETHATGGGGGSVREMRPYGSSYWRRWPEVGIGYYRDESEWIVQQEIPDHLKMIPWRGAREPRDWPDLIRHGGPHEMPWVPTRDDWAPSLDLDYTIPDDERRSA